MIEECFQRAGPGREGGRNGPLRAMRHSAITLSAAQRHQGYGFSELERPGETPEAVTGQVTDVTAGVVFTPPLGHYATRLGASIESALVLPA